MSETHAENSKLPLVSVIDDQPTMTTAAELLQEAAELLTQKKSAEARLDEIKAQLCEIAQAFDLPGMRFGNLGLFYNGEKTRWTLDKRKLIENGVDPELIKECYTESKPYIDARFIPYS